MSNPSSQYDAVVVGSGPNGLAAAITLARAGRSVLIKEAQPTAGGGARSAALTLPGYIHDVCSAAHPLGIASPLFSSLPLEKHGLHWIHSPAECAHPLDDVPAALLYRSIQETASGLGVDEDTYLKWAEPLMHDWERLLPDILRSAVRWPRHPFLMAGFGMQALQSAQGFARSRFKGERARALFAGLAAHSCTPLDWAGSASVGLVLGLAGHDKGWPIPRGGAQKITDALISYFKSLGGEVETSSPVQELADLPPAQIILFDLTPRQILKIAGSDFSPTYRRGLEKFRYGPGVYKMDWALSRPIPWRDPRCAQAATVHLGGTLEQIARSEAAPAKDQIPEKPYVLLCQPSLFDPTRAPEGKHIAWAYCHVPHGSREDMGTRIEDQIERFAPGFRSLVLGRSKRGPAELEHHNANLVGGDISGGLANLTQLIFRPRVGLSPYATSNPKLWICSSSTPPGPGVHGMCGYWAALAAMKAHS